MQAFPSVIPRLFRRWMPAIGSVWNDEREWSIVTEAFPANSGYAFPLTVKARLISLLLETGMALTPAKSVFAPSAWFAVFRYADAFAARSGALRLVSSSTNWESRLTTILAEELGVGVAIHLARNLLGVVHVTDVAPLLAAGDLKIKSPPVSPLRPQARPDYLGELRTGESVVFEAKGAVGTRSRLVGPMSKAEIQVDNVDFVRCKPRTVSGVPCAERVVFGTHFCVDGKHQRSETTTIVRDPPSGSPREEGRRDNSDLAVRVSYAKAFNFAEQPLLARNLVDRQSVAGLESLPSVEIAGRRIRILGEFLGGGLVVVDAGVADALASAGSGDARAAVAGELDRLAEEGRLERPAGLVLLNNGIGLLPMF